MRLGTSQRKIVIRRKSLRRTGFQGQSFSTLKSAWTSRHLTTTCCQIPKISQTMFAVLESRTTAMLLCTITTKLVYSRLPGCGGCFVHSGTIGYHFWMAGFQSGVQRVIQLNQDQRVQNQLKVTAGLVDLKLLVKHGGPGF